MRPLYKIKTLEWKEYKYSGGSDFEAVTILGTFFISFRKEDNLYDLHMYDYQVTDNVIALPLDEAKAVAQQYFQMKLEPALEEIDLNEP